MHPDPSHVSETHLWSFTKPASIRLRDTNLESEKKKQLVSNPIGSMYGIYANVWGILMVNVTIFSIHGSYGNGSTLLKEMFSVKIQPAQGCWTFGDALNFTFIAAQPKKNVADGPQLSDGVRLYITFTIDV